MKKLLTVLLAICLCFGTFFAFAACNDDNTQKEQINVYTPDGATALSLSYAMKNAKELQGYEIKYHVVAPNLITSFVQNGQADMAILPTNAAAALYKQDVGYQYAAAMTHGNLFLIGEDAENIEDLKGSVVGCIGKGQVPDMIFRYVLDRYGIEFEESEEPIVGKVAIRYFANGTLMRNHIAANPNNLKFGVLAAPDVQNTLHTLMTVASVEYQVLFDLQREWYHFSQLDGGFPEADENDFQGYPQAGLFVKKTLDKDFVNEFLDICKQADTYKDGQGWAVVNPLQALQAISDNMDGTSTIVFVEGKESQEVFYCNIKTVTQDLSDYVNPFLLALGMPQAGLPDQNFYF